MSGRGSGGRGGVVEGVEGESHCHPKCQSRNIIKTRYFFYANIILNYSVCKLREVRSRLRHFLRRTNVHFEPNSKWACGRQ